MLSKLKNFIRKLTPEPLLLGYHLVLAKMASGRYGNPSQKLYVIGITGTKGKTSTANFVWSVLKAAGIKTGQIGTANIRLGDREMLNEYHMTMPGPFVLQRMLKQMVDAGCTHVVMEVTSEGIKLHRHVGIIFDCAVFTNLTPEHLPSHGGSFENYKNTKGKLFASLMEHVKQLNGKYVKRVSIVNNDDEHKDFFENFPADTKITYGIKTPADVHAHDIHDSDRGVDFKIGLEPFALAVLGAFNVYNALPAVAVAKSLHIPIDRIRVGLANLKVIDGRMQKIEEGQNFTVIVDYAHEKVSMNAVLDTAKNMAAGRKVIVLLGAEGGGRDKAKRAHMGEAAAKKADYVIVSNVDPYDDDPQEIIHDIANAAVAAGKIIGQNLFREPDRRKGIAKALNLAQPGDIVLITGKGAEQSMIIGGQTIPWDDRVVVKEELQKYLRGKYSQPK
jgi:UDP-N-acetylmuramoyl-L-alanyl-D-glutamate--2,6-diaminopimelate ligase